MGAPRASQVLLRSGTAEQKRQAGTVIPVRRPRRAGLLRLSRGRCTSRAVAVGFDAALRLLARGLIETAPLMHATYPMDDAMAAFGASRGAMKVVLDMEAHS